MDLTKVTERIAQSGRSLFLHSEFRSFALHNRYLAFILLLILLVSALQTARAASLVLKTDQILSEAGYFQLTWKLEGAPAGTVYHVDEHTAEMSLGQPIYQGTDTAMVISGKPDGTYIYNVRSSDNQYVSNTVKVVVKHHALSTAFLFFGLGAIVFIVILVSILQGNRLVTKE